MGRTRIGAEYKKDECKFILVATDAVPTGLGEPTLDEIPIAQIEGREWRNSQTQIEDIHGLNHPIGAVVITTISGDISANKIGTWSLMGSEGQMGETFYYWKRTA